MFMPFAADPFMMPQPVHHQGHHQPSFAPEMPLLPIFDPAVELEDIAGAGLFAIGFVNAFAATNNLTEVQTCMTGLKSEEGELKEIVADFKAGSISDIIDGAKKLVDLLKNAPTDLKQCENISDDITKITTWGKNIFSNPTQILSNVIQNVGDIISEAKATESDFAAGSYEQSGADMDKIVTDVFGTVDTKWENNDDLFIF